jgi:hypothetical protein
MSCVLQDPCLGMAALLNKPLANVIVPSRLIDFDWSADSN